MAMSEIEAKSKIKHRIAVVKEIAGTRFDRKIVEDLEIAVQVLKEIREYRELGTVEELKALKEKKVIPIATIKFNKEDIQEIVDEKVAQIELDIQEIRNNAIDEFAEEIAFGIYESVIWDMLATMSKNGSLSDTSDKIVDYVIETVKEIAEQMKGGATYDRE